MSQKHNHYFKDASKYSQVDVYRVLDMFGVIHPCQQHLAKKALCAGNRGHKDLLRDIQDIIDTAERWKQMLIEDHEGDTGTPQVILDAVAKNDNQVAEKRDLMRKKCDCAHWKNSSFFYGQTHTCNDCGGEVMI